MKEIASTFFKLGSTTKVNFTTGSNRESILLQSKILAAAQTYPQLQNGIRNFAESLLHNKINGFRDN